MRLTLLVTSPRVAPGLMSFAAWQAIRAADRVLGSDPGAALARSVQMVGFTVEHQPVATAAGLLAAAAGGHAVWLATDEEAERLPGELAAAIVAGAQDAGLPEVEVLHASYDVPGARLLDLVTVMDRLREDCPWDRQQTHRSLATYLLEETYETLEAIESGDHSHLQEELGDLLLQVYFHARIASESADEGFTIDDVAGGIVDKLVYRHPHVFAGLEVADADEVDRNWEALKAAEKQRASPLDGIPLALPALSLADKVLGRLEKRGLREPAAPVGGESEVGDDLLALVAGARAAGVDAEQALRDAVRRLGY